MRKVECAWKFALVIVLLAPAVGVQSDEVDEAVPTVVRETALLEGVQDVVDPADATQADATAVEEQDAVLMSSQQIEPIWTPLAVDSSLNMGGCFPPSPPPPSCQCSSCCECNKCWQGSVLVKMPCS